MALIDRKKQFSHSHELKKQLEECSTADTSDKYFGDSCTGFLVRAQWIVWEAQIPYRQEDEQDNKGKGFNEKFETVLSQIGHAERVEEK